MLFAEAVLLAGAAFEQVGRGFRRDRRFFLELRGDDVFTARLALDRRITSALRPLPDAMRRGVARLLGMDPDVTVLPAAGARGLDRLRYPFRRLLEVAAQVRLHCSQGGVEFPTGGKGRNAKPASAPEVREVSRSGVTPEPTVRVRMKENGISAFAGARSYLAALISACRLS